MYTDTKYFGGLDYEQKDMVYLEDGLFGFEDDKNFLLIHFGDKDSIFMCLQSLDHVDLAFILADPFILTPHYDPIIAKEYERRLPQEMDSPVVYYSICVLKNPLCQSTVNLKAPLIISTETRRGLQVMTENPEYTFRHDFLEFGLEGGDFDADTAT